MPRLRALDAAVLVLAGLTGLAAGIGIFTFVYARGASYMTDDPAACANCHVMNEEYGAWMKGPHHTAAVCNDCHTPHGVVSKYLVKARNGFWHSYYFTRGNFPEPIRITPFNRRVTEQACRTCHAGMTHAILALDGEEDSLSCIHCHRSVGHANR